MAVEYPPVPNAFRSPFYSPVAVVPPGMTWVLVGGQNAIDERGAIVGGDDVAAQARQILVNCDAALAAAGCDWSHVVRVTVQLKAGVDARVAFAVFAPVLSKRPSPPLVNGYQVSALARPELLLEVSLEAAR